MAMKGDMLYAWTNDTEIAKRAELGGAVTSLWKYALESKMVDAVFAIRKGKDLYDAQPVLIKDPAELKNTAGSLHCGTLLLPKLVKKYFDGASKIKIGVTVKGCDVMGFIELAKRKQINLDNIVMIGVNCGGSVSPILARKMIADKFGVDPDKVHKEEIDKGQFIIEYEGGHKGTPVDEPEEAGYSYQESGSAIDKRGISMEELEDAGYGRRTNCRRCKFKIPRQADLACGNWGVIGPRSGKATFVEVCSDKGARLLDGAIAKGILSTEPANPKGLDIRVNVERAMLKLGDKWRKKDFTALGTNMWETIAKETSRCIKCYSCIENCPVCFTAVDDLKKGSVMVKPGELAPNPMFHLRRFAHISDSCINCGQCEELCPMDIPLALFSHAIRVEADAMFEPKLGKATYTN